MLWTQPLFLTLQLMAVAVAIAAVIGIVGAWAAASLETNRFGGRWVVRGFVASMVIAVAMPMILHAAAWEATAGKFGWLMMTQTGTRADGAGRFGFFAGLLACGWIHGLFGAAIVALATWFATRRTPSALIDQARMDKGPLMIWWLVRLPIASPWVVTAVVATALLAATEMTVVNLYGYRTLADEFYLFYAVDPSPVAIVMTCGLPLAIASAVLIWMFVSRRRLLTGPLADKHSPPESEPLSATWRIVLTGVAISVALVVMLVPAVGLLVKVGHQVTVEQGQVRAAWSAVACFERLLDAPRTFTEEYFWTAMLGLLTSIVAVLVAWPVAAVGRTHRKWERWFDAGTVIMVTVPGPVVGMTVVRLFQLPVPGFQSLYQQSLLPTILALSVRAIPVAYWVLRAGYRGIDRPVLESAMMEVSWAARLWRIDRPLLKSSLLAASLASAIVASGDIPATLPVIPPDVTTVGTRLFGLLHSGARYQEAALAIWYVVAVVAISLVLLRQTAATRVRVM